MRKEFCTIYRIRGLIWLCIFTHFRHFSCTKPTNQTSYISKSFLFLSRNSSFGINSFWKVFWKYFKLLEKQTSTHDQRSDGSGICFEGKRRVWYANENKKVGNAHSKPLAYRDFSCIPITQTSKSICAISYSIKKTSTDFAIRRDLPFYKNKQQRISVLSVKKHP